MRQRLIYAFTWLAAVTVATGVGMSAIDLVGEAIRGTGGIGETSTLSDLNETNETRFELRPDPDAESVDRTLYLPFGQVSVRCTGLRAELLSAVAAPEWRLGEQEHGPDEDVDVRFIGPDRIMRVDVFCPNGVPRQAELEPEPLPRSTVGGMPRGADSRDGGGGGGDRGDDDG
ncbi:MAG: hypothetical protein M3467_12370, partial [Actinomycetota bacterium]|nr:hypothetical protein [Actinomycetota bacterium]